MAKATSAVKASARTLLDLGTASRLDVSDLGHRAAREARELGASEAHLLPSLAKLATLITSSLGAISRRRHGEPFFRPHRGRTLATGQLSARPFASYVGVVYAPWLPVLSATHAAHGLFLGAYKHQDTWASDVHHEFWTAALPLWPRRGGNPRVAGPPSPVGLPLAPPGPLRRGDSRGSGLREGDSLRKMRVLGEARAYDSCLAKALDRANRRADDRRIGWVLEAATKEGFINPDDAVALIFGSPRAAASPWKPKSTTSTSTPPRMTDLLQAALTKRTNVTGKPCGRSGEPGGRGAPRRENPNWQPCPNPYKTPANRGRLERRIPLYTRKSGRFASRRSPVRARLAPSGKALLSAGFSDRRTCERKGHGARK